jgi:hypothetical protein
MNRLYVKALVFVIISHSVKWAAEYAYFTRCAGFFASIFTWNSSTCRGLRWISESVITNVATVVAGQVTNFLAITSS